jgi:magnesium chelatase family protein
VLAAADVIPRAELGWTVLLGELGLDGRVRPVHAILPAVLAAAQAGFTRVVVPVRQAGEARLVDNLEVLVSALSVNWWRCSAATRCWTSSPSR